MTENDKIELDKLAEQGQLITSKECKNLIIKSILYMGIPLVIVLISGFTLMWAAISENMPFIYISVACLVLAIMRQYGLWGRSFRKLRYISL